MKANNVRVVVTKLLLAFVIVAGSAGAVLANTSNNSCSAKCDNKTCNNYDDGKVTSTGTCTKTADKCDC